MNLLTAKIDKYNISLSDSEIQIFYLSVPDYLGQMYLYEKLLQPQELLRSLRFFKTEDKERFVVCRGVLKQLAGHFVKCDPQLIDIVSDENKKPVIKDCRNVHFNISHSKNCAAFAFSHSKVGIDVEYVNNDFNYKPAAELCFTGNEIKSIEEDDKPVKKFFNLWTRKEALLKASGKGINDDMNKLDCLGKTCVSEMRDLNYDDYTIDSFETEEDYIAGIAYKGSEKKLSIYRI